MTKIIIFDLDDTLVNYRMKIPRQTYHMLNKFKKLGYIIGIITYNCIINLVANECNLYKYTNYIFYGDLDRNVLFEKCINKILEENPSSLDWQIYYADDCADNLQLVKCYYPEITTYHCKNMYELYLFKFIICDTIFCF